MDQYGNEMYQLDGMQGMSDDAGNSYMNMMDGMSFSPYDLDMNMGNNAMNMGQQMQQQEQGQQQHGQQQNIMQQQEQQHHTMQPQQVQDQQDQQQNDQDDPMDEIDGMGESGAEARDQGNTVIGAGPLPTSYGMQLASTSGSHLSEFTKRRNWSQRVIEELKDFLHILSSDGRILYASPSAKALTGHDDTSLTGQLIFEYLHPDDAAIFVREFNEAISTGNTLRFFYRFRKPDNTYTIFESHGHPHLTSDPGTFNPNNPPPSSLCRGFFMMSRPYPTRNASLLDSFLEHKIENERLKKRIAELKREEQEDLLQQRRAQQNTASPPSGRPNIPTLKPTTSVDSSATHTSLLSDSALSHSLPFNPSMPPPAKPTPSNHPLTHQNLSEALAASRPDSINDKMARYEGVTHLESIEMLTGLLYRDGERANGISTGAASPTLVRQGEGGVPIVVDKDGRPISKLAGGAAGELTDKQKKKLKLADEYVCTDCGTLDSPEWRKGPGGPKTLCNACGLRWAKKEKKRTGVSVSGVGSVGMSAGTGGGTTPMQGGGTTPMQREGGGVVQSGGGGSAMQGVQSGNGGGQGGGGAGS